MRITTFATLGLLLLGVSACNNPKPSDAAPAPTAAEITATPDGVLATDAMATDPATANLVTPESTSVVPAPVPGVSEEPRSLPDRRTDTPKADAEEAPPK